MGWILFLIGLWLIPFILCIITVYFCWRDEREAKTAECFVNYLFKVMEDCNHWPFITPFINICILICLFGKYIFLLFKDKELY